MVSRTIQDWLGSPPSLGIVSKFYVYLYIKEMPYSRRTAEVQQMSMKGICMAFCVVYLRALNKNLRYIYNKGVINKGFVGDVFQGVCMFWWCTRCPYERVNFLAV